jgi:murein DD-endopeptidase MepM/ murein hydrolase activator NlpD
MWRLYARTIVLGVAAPVDSSQLVVRIARTAQSASRMVGPRERWPIAVRPLPRLTADPVDGGLSSPFGYREDPIHKRRKHHSGIDFDAERGRAVRAAGSGTVIKAERYYGYGRVVFVDHGMGMVSRYAHLQSIAVREGDHVSAGMMLGSVGSTGRATGPHLHFEVRVDDIPIDPARVMDTPLVPGRPRPIDAVLDLLAPKTPELLRRSASAPRG